MARDRNRKRPLARWAWRVLLLVQLANLLDWATTVIGAGALGIPERSAATALLMRHLGVVGGATAIKVAAALVFGALGAACMRLASQEEAGAEIAAAGLLWWLGYAALMLGETVAGNLASIWHALTGR
jgi:hypothetical protein